jgi:hypothetical protein
MFKDMIRQKAGAKAVKDESQRKPQMYRSSMAALEMAQIQGRSSPFSLRIPIVDRQAAASFPIEGASTSRMIPFDRPSNETLNSYFRLYHCSNQELLVLFAWVTMCLHQ